MLTFCLPANVYIVSICIIVGALSNWQCQCQCFTCENVFLIFALGRIARNTVPYFPIHSQGRRECIGKYGLCGSYHSNHPCCKWIYQKIPSYAVMNIGSVKINISLIIMREYTILYQIVVLYCHHGHLIDWSMTNGHHGRLIDWWSSYWLYQIVVLYCHHGHLIDFPRSESGRGAGCIWQSSPA